MNKPLTYLAVAALAAAAIAAVIYSDTNAPGPGTTPTPVACTLEAKICPDGTAVGRTGPNCEFEPCPTPQPMHSIPVSPIPPSY